MPTRQLAAIMFTDMVGYTAMMQQNEAQAIQQRNYARKILEDTLGKYDGKLLQYYGDGTLSIFSSALNAVKSATEIQTLNKQYKVDMRIGIHTGDVMYDDNGIYGDSVNVASRIESLAVPGSVFISEKLFNEISNHGIEAKPLGYFELKNVQQPIQVYAIVDPAMICPSREDIRGKVKQTFNTLAVLPFSSMSADPENEYFCDGLAEELINVLSKIEGIQVTSRTSSFAFKGKQVDIREIAAQLNVQKIIEGSVRKSGNKVRITVQLINAADGYHFWSESYDRSFEDIFDIQDDISRNIANKLRQNLTDVEHEKQLVKPPTDNLTAYKKYIEGLHLQSRQTIPDALSGLRCFEEAVEMEPNFINPYFNIAEMNAFFSHAGFRKVEDAAKECKKAASMAMKIDPRNAWSQLSAGIYAFFFEGNIAKAGQYLEEAIHINQNIAIAHLYLGWYYMITKQHDRMLKSLHNAYMLDPLGGMTLATAADLCFLAGDFETSLEYSHSAITLDEHNGYAWASKAFVTGFQGKWEEAIKIIEPLYQAEPNFNFAITYLGYAYAKSGNIDKALFFINVLEEKQKSPEEPALHHLLSILYLAIGDKEKFYSAFESGLRSKVFTCLNYYNSPLLAEVRGEERLVVLGKEYGLPI